jgi:uncharacterized membrane protein
MQKIEIKNTLLESFQFVKKNFYWLFMVEFFVSLLFIPSILLFPTEAGQTSLFIPAMSMIISILVLTFYFSPNILNIFLKLWENEKVQISDLFIMKDVKLNLNYFIVVVLTGLMIFGGMILFVVPGVILALMTSLSMYLVYDKRLKPIESIRTSINLTKGQKGQLLIIALFSLIPTLIIMFLPQTILSEIDNVLISEIISAVFSTLSSIYIAAVGLSVYKKLANNI